MPITDPMISFGIVISVVRVGTTPALVVVVVWCPIEAAEFASEAKVAAAKGFQRLPKKVTKTKGSKIRHLGRVQSPSRTHTLHVPHSSHPKRAQTELPEISEEKLKKGNNGQVWAGGLGGREWEKDQRQGRCVLRGRRTTRKRKRQTPRKKIDGKMKRTRIMRREYK